MRIAYSTLYDPYDVRRGSGIPYYLIQEFERQGHTILQTGPLDIRFPFFTKFFRLISHKLNKRYQSYQDPFVGKVIGEENTKKLRGLEYDILLTNDYCIAGYTQTTRPIFIYTDALFPYNASKNISPLFHNISKISELFSVYTNKQGFHKTKLCMFSSQYLIDEAISDYGVNYNKLVLIPYGANIDRGQNTDNSERIFENVIKKNRIDLLFVGKDWKRKGGETAIDITKELIDRGINAILHIVGSNPEVPVDTNYIKLYGLLDKSRENDKETIHNLFLQSDVFLLPSIAEGFGIAYVEAAANGLPSLGYKSTGITNAVKDGQSGILFDLGSTSNNFADTIASWYEYPQKYNKLAAGARKFYQLERNWEISVNNIIEAVETSLAKHDLHD